MTLVPTFTAVVRWRGPDPTIELETRALKKARAAGHSASELVRKGLRVVASRYYSARRPPTTGLFESTDSKLGDESLLFTLGKKVVEARMCESRTIHQLAASSCTTPKYHILHSVARPQTNCTLAPLSTHHSQ
jgi:hypothetical protein